MLVRKIFKDNRHLFWIQSISHWIGLITLLLIVIWDRDEWYIYPIFLFLYFVFVIYEVIIFMSNPVGYISDIYTWMNLPIYAVGIYLAHYAIIRDSFFLTNIYWNFLSMLYFGIYIFRSITMLRVMDGSRYMIEMIFASFKNMRYFLLLIALFILGIGTLRIVLKIPDHQFEGTFEEFWRVSDMIYNEDYKDKIGRESIPWNVYLLYLFTSIFIALVLMNMLIAIILQTFEQYSGDRLREDTKQMLKVLSEMNTFIRVFYSPKTTLSTSSFHHFIKKKETHEISGQELRERMETLRNEMEKTEKRINEGIDARFKNNINIIRSEMNDLKSEILRSIREMKDIKGESS